jgi:hypothetical protein
MSCPICDAETHDPAHECSRNDLLARIQMLKAMNRAIAAQYAESEQKLETSRAIMRGWQQREAELATLEDVRVQRRDANAKAERYREALAEIYGKVESLCEMHDIAAFREDL